MIPPNKAVCRAADGEVIETSWGNIVWTASRQVGNSTTMTLGRATLRAGQQNPRHRHPNCDEVLHVISGRIEHALGDESYTLEPGDSISIPQGIWHRAEVLGNEDAVLVICFSSADRLTEVDE